MTRQSHGLASAAGPAAQPVAPRRGRAVLAGSAGNLVENFDGALYAFLAPYFSQQFFPSHDPASALLLTVGAYGSGFVMKPVGAIWFGSLGDRRGRRTALYLSIAVMALGSVMIAACPPYALIGPLAPVVLVLARLLTGFSTGGEFGLSSAYLVEYAPAGRRAFVGCTQQVTVIAGTLLASAFVAGLAHVGPAGAMHNWVWRVPFAVGAVLCAAAAWLRFRVDETPSYRKVEAVGTKAVHPVWEVLRRYPRQSLQVVGMSIAGIMTYHVWLQFLPSYAHQSTGISLADAQTANTVALLLMLPAIPLAALLSDRLGRRPTLLIFGIGLGVLVYPMLAILQLSPAGFVIAQLGGALLMAFYMANGPVVKAELFPSSVRASGISFPYSLASVVFGGSAPLVTGIFAGTGQFVLFGVYVTAVCLISSVVFWRLPETKDVELD